MEDAVQDRGYVENGIRKWLVLGAGMEGGLGQILAGLAKGDRVDGVCVEQDPHGTRMRW